MKPGVDGVLVFRSFAFLGVAAVRAGLIGGGEEGSIGGACFASW
jgi:hypothetical protein